MKEDTKGGINEFLIWMDLKRQYCKGLYWIKHIHKDVFRGVNLYYEEDYTIQDRK